MTPPDHLFAKAADRVQGLGIAAVPLDTLRYGHRCGAWLVDPRAGRAVGGFCSVTEFNRSVTSGPDVWIVAGLGLLGGGLASAVAVRKVVRSAAPYDVPLALALLKVPTGALTAVTGIPLLGGGFVPGFSELDTQRQILAYALIFGYAPQLATRYLDDRATNLLAEVPGKHTPLVQTRSLPPTEAPQPPSREAPPDTGSVQSIRPDPTTTSDGIS